MSREINLLFYRKDSLAYSDTQLHFYEQLGDIFVITEKLIN